MKQTELFTKTLKDVPAEAVALNHKLLIRGGFIDQLSSGIFTYTPLGFRVLKKIECIIRKQMNEIGGQEILMPSLVPKENWQKTERWDIDVVFKVKSGTKKDYGLGWTHEEVITPLVKKYISSYRDLPLAVYQIQTKFRDELRAKSGILRGREFLMKDLYSFHAEEKDLDFYYEKVKESYCKIFNEVGIGKETYLTLASGGTFSKFSHEFQTLSSAGEDLIYICEKCNVAINCEIINSQKKCPSCGQKKFLKEKAIEVGNIFKLNTKYSKPFNLDFSDKNGKKQIVLMGCYGMGLSRLMGAIVEVKNDKDGIIWPQSVAPFNVHLLSLDKEGHKQAEKIYKILISQDIEVLWDDRDCSAGLKFKDADLMGIPIRVIASQKNISQGKLEIKKRDSQKPVMVSINGLVPAVKRMI